MTAPTQITAETLETLRQQAAQQIYVSLSSGGQETCRGGADSPEEAAEVFAELGAEVASVMTLEEFRAKHSPVTNWRHPYPTQFAMEGR